jgi:hypothetical protein
LSWFLLAANGASHVIQSLHISEARRPPVHRVRHVSPQSSRRASDEHSGNNFDVVIAERAKLTEIVLLRRVAVGILDPKPRQ